MPDRTFLLRALPYFVFCLILLAALFILRPGWGLMDDPQSVRTAVSFMHSDDKVASLTGLFSQEIDSGRFRPSNVVWILTGYGLFSEHPGLFYFLVFVLGLVSLPLWGYVIRLVWGEDLKDTEAVWFYPLLFFCFTPFFNLFLYLSVQERLVYWFSLGSIYFLYRAFSVSSWKLLLLSFMLIVGGVFSKETGIAVMLALGAGSLFCGLRDPERRKMAFVFAAAAGIFIVGYYVFIRSIMSGYSAKYAGLSLNVIMQNVGQAPLMVKLLLLAGMAQAGWMLFRWEQYKTWQGIFPVIGGFLLAAYLLVLAPWGFMNYLLAPLAPFIFIVLFPLYRALEKRVPWARFLFGILALLVLTGVLLPRLADIASVRPLTEFLKKDGSGSVYYFPADSLEAPIRLQELTGRTFKYVETRELSRQDIVTVPGALLIVNRRSPGISLVGLKPGHIIYGDHHWRVVELLSDEAVRGSYQVVFPETPLQTFAKKLSR